jgi:hypothetical protein
MRIIPKSDDNDDDDEADAAGARIACSWRHAASPRVDSVANSASVIGGSLDDEEEEDEEEERLADAVEGTSGAN